MCLTQDLSNFNILFLSFLIKHETIKFLRDLYGFPLVCLFWKYY